MNSSGDPTHSQFQPPPETEGDASKTTGGDGPSLEDVVRETLGVQGEASGTAQGASPEVWNAFVEVARCHGPKQPLDVAIVAELVECVLASSFEKLRDRPDVLAHCTHRVADTLWEDTPSRERLDRLWNHLRQETP